MKCGPSFLIAGAIMLSCYFQVENASRNARDARLGICRLENKLISIDRKMDEIDSQIKKSVHHLTICSKFLVSIEKCVHNTRQYIESIEFLIRKNMKQEEVKVEFLDGKLVRR